MVASWSFVDSGIFFCNDRSHSDALRFNVSGFNFRDTVAGYVHYRKDGTIAPVVIDAQGVATHSFRDFPRLPAENYFFIEGAEKAEGPGGGFEIVGLRHGSSLSFGNVRGLSSDGVLSLRLSNGGHCAGDVSVYVEAADQRFLFASCDVNPTGSWDTYAEVACRGLRGNGGIAQPSVTLALLFAGSCSSEEFAHLDHIEFVNELFV